MTVSSDPIAPSIRFTPAQLARHLAQHGLAIGAGAVRRWARTRRLPCWRSPSGRILFDAAVVPLLLNATTVAADGDLMPS